MKYYNTETFKRVDISDETYNNWVTANNPKAVVYQPVPEPPAYDSSTQRVEWIDGWQVIDFTPEEIASANRKVWASKAEFWAEFTPQEQLAIMNSEIPDIKLLDRLVLVWGGEFWSDDERVQQGLDGLVSVGILTSTRKEEILAK
jgi:hypothetical protein